MCDTVMILEVPISCLFTTQYIILLVVVFPAEYIVMSGNGLLCSRRREYSFPLKTVCYYYYFSHRRIGKAQSAVRCKIKCLHGIQLARSFEKILSKAVVIQHNYYSVLDYIEYIYIIIILYAFSNIPLDYFN